MPAEKSLLHGYGNKAGRLHLGKLLRGRPPVLLGHKSVPKPSKQQNSSWPHHVDSEVSNRHPSTSSSSSRAFPQSSLSLMRSLCLTAKDYAVASNELAARKVMWEAVGVALTSSDCSWLMCRIVDLQCSDPPLLRTLAARVVDALGPGTPARDIARCSHALGKANLWDARLGDQLVRAMYSPSGNSSSEGQFLEKQFFWKDCNTQSLSMLCRFISVFRREMSSLGFPLLMFIQHLNRKLTALESKGEVPSIIGLASMTHSLARLRDGGINEGVAQSIGPWLRTRVLRDLAKCESRQLASLLHDFLDLSLMTGPALTSLKREIDRAYSLALLKPRDLVSIASGYARLPVEASERRNLISNMIPQLISCLSSCKASEFCGLVHGMAKAHLWDRALLEAWASHYKDFSKNLTPIQLSILSADLAKLRFVNDTYNTFGMTLNSIADVSSMLGGLAVCHVICALARVSRHTITDNVSEAQRSLVYFLGIQLVDHMHDLEPQGLTASAAAFAKLRHYSDELFNGFADAALPRFAAFSPEDFAMLSSALSGIHATLHATSWQGDPLKAMGSHASDSLQVGLTTWTPRQVAEVLQPFAFMQLLCTELFQAAERHFREKLAAYDPRNMFRLMQSFCNTGHLGRFHIHIFWRRSGRMLHSFDGRQLVSAAEMLVQFRHEIPTNELRRKFRRLAEQLQEFAKDLPSSSIVALVCTWAKGGMRDWLFCLHLQLPCVPAMKAVTSVACTPLT